MDQSLIFWPMIAHAALVFIVYFELGRRRFHAAKAGKLKMDDYKILGRSIEPDACAQAARNIVNNFEVPLLFHGVVLALFVTNLVTFPLLVLAWLFVGSRIAHTIVHLSYNHVMHRGFCFFVGVFTLVAMWVLFASTLYSGAI